VSSLTVLSDASTAAAAQIQTDFKHLKLAYSVQPSGSFVCIYTHQWRLAMKIFTTALTIILSLGAVSNSANASNVSAKISGGNLFIYGDNNDNHLTIESTQSNRITVTGISTTVNGGSEAVTFNNWTGGIFVYLYQGHDSLALLSGDVLGATHLDMGEGDDDVVIGAIDSIPEEFLFDPIFDLIFGAEGEHVLPLLRLRQSLTVLGVGGHDRVSVSNGSVLAYTTFNLGSGDDEIYVGGNSGTVTTFFHNSIIVLPGSGVDLVEFTDTNIRKDLTIDDPSQTSTVDLLGVRVGQNLLIFTSLANDIVGLEDVRVGGLLKVISKDGTDQVRYTDVVAYRAEVFLGIGDDIFSATELWTNNLWVYLEGGADLMELKTSEVPTSHYFGGSGNDRFILSGNQGTNAYVYGESGTDALSVSANSIRNVRAYSIERRF
jgi:hypothetical protein